MGARKAPIPPPTSPKPPAPPAPPRKGHRPEPEAWERLVKRSAHSPIAQAVIRAARGKSRERAATEGLLIAIDALEKTRRELLVYLRAYPRPELEMPHHLPPVFAVDEAKIGKAGA